MVLNYDLGGYKIRHRVEDISQAISSWEGEGGSNGYNTPTEHHYVSVFAKDGNPVGHTFLRNVHSMVDLELRQNGEIPRYTVSNQYIPALGHAMTFYTSDKGQLPAIENVVNRIVSQLTYG